MQEKEEARKGNVGYLRVRKKKEILKTSTFFGIILIIFAAGWIVTGTKNNYATMVSVVLVLPAARFAVNLIAVAMHKSTPLELSDKVMATAPDVINCFDCIASNSKKPIGLIAVSITDNNICCLTEKKLDDLHFYEKSIKDFLKNDKLSSNVTLYTDEDTYLKRIKLLQTNFNASDKNVSDKAQWLKDSFLNMCL